MKRAELVDLIARATEASGQDQVYVIGSQAILATYDESRLPANIWMSPEADMFPITDDEAETVSMRMEIYGEASDYTFRTGYFIDPVSRSTAKLPEGWEKRVVKIRTRAPLDSPRKTTEPASVWKFTTSAPPSSPAVKRRTCATSRPSL